MRIYLILEVFEVLSPLLNLLSKVILDGGALLGVVDLQVEVDAKVKTTLQLCRRKLLKTKRKKEKAFHVWNTGKERKRTR